MRCLPLLVLFVTLGAQELTKEEKQFVIDKAEKELESREQAVLVRAALTLAKMPEGRPVLASKILKLDKLRREDPDAVGHMGRWLNLMDNYTGYVKQAKDVPEDMIPQYVSYFRVQGGMSTRIDGSQLPMIKLMGEFGPKAKAAIKGLEYIRDNTEGELQVEAMRALKKIKAEK